MSRKLLTGNAAAAWGARLAEVEYVPAFPITPQTEIIETISQWIDSGEFESKMVTLDSEHSMITAAGAAAVTGVRVFTATSSQGLLYAMEMLYTVAGWRAPFVMINVSRAVSAPITLEPDHTDILAARDCGMLQIHCSTCQEVLDNTLIAYRIAEHERVRLPVIVNEDGFYLSFTREPVEIPDSDKCKKFIGEYNPENVFIKGGAPSSHGVAVLGGAPYSYFRYQTHLAALEALDVYEEVTDEFAEMSGRKYEAVECYRTEDAELVFFMMGCFATKAKEAVDRLRETGLAIGLLRPRLFRPFPSKHIQNALAGKKGVAVVDQNLSMGKGGVLFMELTSVLYSHKDAPPIIASFIGGLGGRDITPEEFYEIASSLQKAVDEDITPPVRLLYTRKELREVRKLQAIAHTEQQGRIKRRTIQ